MNVEDLDTKTTTAAADLTVVSGHSGSSGSSGSSASSGTGDLIVAA